MVGTNSASEERIAESHEYKLDRYNLLDSSNGDGAVTILLSKKEHDARGVVAESLERAARRAGFKGMYLRIEEVGEGQWQGGCALF